MNNKLMELITDITDLEYTINLINWELRISGSNESKDYLIDVISRLEKKYYNLITSNEYGTFLKEELDNKELSDIERIQISNLYKDYKKNKCICEDFYIEYNKNILISTKVWEKAKKEKEKYRND